MFCTRCGTPLQAGAAFCNRCGLPAGMPPPGACAPAAELGDSAAMRMLLPVGRSWLAIVAGYLGLFALVVFPAPLALVAGAIAVWDLRRHPEKRGWGRAGFAVVAGALGTAALVAILASHH
jgi:hypothetical protein